MSRSDGGRAIVVGTAAYSDFDPLPSVADDVSTVGQLLERLGYGVERTVVDPRTEELRRLLVEQADSGADHAVFYYSGHGDREGSRHYLLCTDSKMGMLAGTALPTEDVVRILTAGTVRRLFVILDTCLSGDGALDAVRAAAEQLAVQLVSVSGARTERLTALAVLAATRPRRAAHDGAFAAALSAAVADHTLGGTRQQYLDLAQLVGRINEDLARQGVRQHAVPVEVWREPDFGFLPNPRYRSDLPDQGVDLAVQNTWLSSRSEDMAGHFIPRGRGSDGFSGETAFYFSGRTAVLHRLAEALTGDDGPPAVFLTGSAGAGKSAVLGHLVSLADADISGDPRYTRVPGNVRVDIAVHARRRSAGELVARLAEGAGVPADSVTDLLTAIRDHGRPLRIVVDALDEAGASDDEREPLHIAHVLLRPLVEIPGVRLIVGARRHLGSALGNRFTQVDLDDHRWLSLDDLTEYARRLLIEPHGPDSTSPYDAVSAVPVAEVLARQAYPNFLNARLTARELASRPDVTAATELSRLPIAEPNIPASRTFRWALSSRLEADNERARTLLTPFAYVQGAGLPAAGVWTVMAGALSGRPVTEADLTWVLAVAGPYLVEVLDRHGRSVYRLYHEAFAEDLRDTSPPGGHSLMVQALIQSVPLQTPDVRDWEHADVYLLTHLAEHARLSGDLDDLVQDPEFLVNADRSTLRPALSAVESERGSRMRRVYEQSAQRLGSDSPLPERRAALQMSAHLAGLPEVGTTWRRLPMSWKVRWAFADDTTEQRRIGYHDSAVTATAWCFRDERPVLIVGDADGSLHAWDYTTGARLAGPTRLHPNAVIAITTVTDDAGGTRVISVGDDAGLSQWDPFDTVSTGPTIQLDGHRILEAQVVAVRVADNPVAAVGWNGQIAVFDLTTGALVSHHRVGSDYASVQLALTSWRDEPSVLATSYIDVARLEVKVTCLVSLSSGRMRRRRRLLGDRGIPGNFRNHPTVIRSGFFRHLFDRPPHHVLRRSLGNTVKVIKVGVLTNDRCVVGDGERPLLVMHYFTGDVSVTDLTTGAHHILVRQGRSNLDLRTHPSFASDGDPLIAVALGRTVTVVSGATAGLDQRHRWKGMLSYSTCLAFDRIDGRQVVYVDGPEGVEVRALDSGEVVPPTAKDKPTVDVVVRRVKGAIDHRFLVETSTDGSRRIGQVRRHRVNIVPSTTSTIDVALDHRKHVARFKDLSDQSTFALPLPDRYIKTWSTAESDGKVVICVASFTSSSVSTISTDRGQWQHSFGTDTVDSIFTASLRNHPVFVVCTDNGFIYMLDAVEGNQLGDPIQNGRSRVQSIDVRKVGGRERLAVAGDDYIIGIWDAERLALLTAVDVGSAIYAVRIAEDGALIALTHTGLICIDTPPI